MNEQLKIINHTILYGKFSWDSSYGVWERTKYGDAVKILKLNWDPNSAKRDFYSLRDTEYGRDYQHTTRNSPQGEFFFPCDEALGKTLFLKGEDADSIVESTKVGRLYHLTWKSGKKSTSITPTVMRWQGMNCIESEHFVLEDTIKDQNRCADCFGYISRPRLEILECGHQYHTGCLWDKCYDIVFGFVCCMCEASSR